MSVSRNFSIFLIILLTLATAFVGQECPAKAPAALTPDDSLSAQLTKVKALTKQHSYLRAKALGESLLAAHRNDPEVHLTMAGLYREMGLWTNALSEFKSVTRLRPSDSGSYVAMSEMQRENLNFEEALKCAKQAVAAAPKNKEASMCLVQALLANRDLNPAEAEMRTLELNFANDAEVKYLAFKLNRELGRHREAEVKLIEAVELSPTRMHWLVDLADMKVADHDYSAAQALLEKAIAGNPQSLDARNHLANLLEFSLHDYDGAISQYRQILAIDPDSVTAASSIERCDRRKYDVAGTWRRQLWGFIDSLQPRKNIPVQVTPDAEAPKAY